MLEVSADSLANINDAILVNLKPNEDFETNSNPFMPMSAMDALLSGKKWFWQQRYSTSLPNYNVILFT